MRRDLRRHSRVTPPGVAHRDAPVTDDDAVGCAWTSRARHSPRRGAGRCGGVRRRRGASSRPRTTNARRRPRSHRARRGRCTSPGRRGAADRGIWTAARLAVTLEPCTMCAGGDRAGADGPARLRGMGSEGRRGGVALGCGAGSAAEPPSRGRSGGACAGVPATARRLLRRQALTGFGRPALARAPVVCPAVACPSGRRSAPRKRVR